MNFKNKKILVTGGSGFIGENFIKRLKILNEDVVNYDISNGNDILDKKSLAEFIKKKYDVIYHLAGYSGSSESNENVEKSYRINTFATVNLLNLISRYSPNTKIILSSSRLEYGVPKYLPVDEKHPTNPTSAYGLSKLAATQMAMVYYRKNGLDVTVFRTSNVYGPHPPAKFTGYNTINHFIDLAKNNKILTIFGDGEQERDYLYIGDLIDAFILTAIKNSDNKIYNLGFEQGIKFKDMVYLIVKKVGKGKGEFKDWPKDFKDVETGSYISDISKIKKELGFKPKINFEEGVYKTVNNIL